MELVLHADLRSSPCKIVLSNVLWNQRGRTNVSRSTLGGLKKLTGMRDKAAHNGAPHARPERKHSLQQARGTKTSNRVSQCDGFTLEKPPGHRKPHRRIPEMNQPHESPPKRCIRTLGEAHCAQGSKVISEGQAPNVP